jgi:hypothetical protein
LPTSSSALKPQQQQHAVEMIVEERARKESGESLHEDPPVAVHDDEPEALPPSSLQDSLKKDIASSSLGLVIGKTQVMVEEASIVPVCNFVVYFSLFLLFVSCFVLVIILILLSTDVMRVRRGKPLRPILASVVRRSRNNPRRRHSA